MKTKSVLKGVLLIAAIVIGSASVSAKGKISVAPYLKTSYAVISVEPTVEDLYSVAIFNSFGEIVYSSNKLENGATFSKLFDFSKLEDGEYKVRLRGKGITSVEERFIVKDGALASVDASKDVLATDVKIWKRSDYVFVSHLNRNLNAMVVRLEDARGSVIYDKTLPAELTYSGKFNVSSLPKGNYALSFVSGNKVFSYEFKK